MKHSVTLLFIVLLTSVVKTELKAQFSPTVYLDYGLAAGDDQGYLWKFNSEYTIADSGINYMAVAFNYGDGYYDPVFPLGSITYQPFPNSFFIDSIFINLTHENNSGNLDYFVIQIVNLVGGNQPGNTIFFEWIDSSNTSLSSNGNWTGTGSLFQLAVPVMFSSNQPFGVVFHYYDPSFMDTCGIVGTSIDNGSGGTNIPSVYPSSYTQYPPISSSPVQNISLPNIPLNSGGLFAAQNWMIVPKLVSAQFGNGSMFYTYLSSVSPNCNNNGTITASNYGGIPPFSYLWSNSETTQTISGLAPGFYSVTVTDDSGYVETGNCNLFSSCSNIIQGAIFNDMNGNCIQDAGELPFQFASVTADNGNQIYYGCADFYGNYSINIPVAGTFNINAFNPSYSYDTCGSILSCNSGTVTFSSIGDTSVGNDFTTNSSIDYNLGIYITWSGANPGFQMHYNLYPYDMSSPSFPGLETVTFHYDANLVYDSSNNAQVTHNITNHTLTHVGIGASNWYFNAAPIVCYFHVPVTLSPYYVVESDFYIGPTTNDCDTSNNHLHTSGIVTGSYDPNEKTVTPAGNITSADSVLTYNIHFQNTGNDTTHFVIVTDTLPSQLDPATVVNLASSDPFSEFSISGTGILKWVFNPLFLPDSASNEPASKGFVMFKVKVKPNLPIGTQINNTASIYFDYNAPVITNTASNIIISGINELTVNSNQLTVYPNPAAEQVTVSSNNQAMKNITVTDVLGMVVQSSEFKVQSAQLDISSIASGVYFVKVQLQNGGVVVKRFVKE